MNLTSYMSFSIVPISDASGHRDRKEASEMSAPQPPTSEPTPGTSDVSDLVSERSKYAERMAQPAAQAPAKLIGIVSVVVFIIICVVVAFFATGGFSRFTAKPRAEAPIIQLASVGASPVQVITA